MKLLDYFAQFLPDKVNLNQSRLDDLDTRVTSITQILKESDNLDGKVLDTIPQGSWAHKTIIRPALGLEFDADFLVQLVEDYSWNLDPQKYNDAIWDALNAHGTYVVRSTRKNRCVRVRYANLCHIDIVPYVVMANGAQVIVNRTTNTFEDTNPVGFTAWLQEKDDLTNGNLRRVLRLLKYLRDQANAFSIKSVLLTTLVGSVVDSWRAVDTDHYKDVPTTLVNLVEELDAWLQARPYKPSITDPSCPSTSFDHRWTENQYATFRDDIHKLAPKVRAAYDVEGRNASVTAWRDVFGDAFPKSLAPKTTTASSLVKAVFPHAGRAPKEQFIEEMFAVELTHGVSVTCEVSEPPGMNRPARRAALRTRGGRVVKQRQLLFKITSTDVPAPYRVFWKVRNQGDEANKAGQLRGEITEDEGGQQKSEQTLYAGHHWVECYIIKNGICVAKTREPVVIL
jgi:hypothetical protein